MRTNTILDRCLLIFIIVITIYGFFAAYNYDFRSQGLRGDSASHLLQAVSLANDFDLRYEEGDEKHWLEVGWKSTPAGLHFQKYSEGFAFAKPYGYSVFLAFFYFFFATKGVILANYTLFILIGVCLCAVLIKKYSTTSTLLLLLSFLLFSYCYLYIFYLHSDIFLAFLSALFVYLFATGLTSKRRIFVYLLGALTVFIICEKIAASMIVLPLFGYFLFSRKEWRILLKIVPFCFFCWFLFSLPYLYYSDFKAFTPYSGARCKTKNYRSIFKVQSDDDLRFINTKKHFETKNIYEKLTDFKDLKNKAKVGYYYFFGSLTGMFLFIPICFFLLVGYLLKLPRNLSLANLVVPLSLLLYILFYIWFFPRNYYGGGQSIGNRYFLQIFPFFALLPFMITFSPRAVKAMAIGACILSLGFIFHHHKKPNLAYLRTNHSGYLQRFMPFELANIIIPRTIELTPVNERLYPFPPKSYRYCYDTKSTINGYTVYQEESYKTYLCSQHDFVKIGDPKILREGTISGHTVYTDTGFYTAFEGFRAWSKKRSTLYLANTGQTFKFGITRLVPETNVRATIGKRDFATNKQKTVYVDTSKENSQWIQIHFESDISANPETLKKRGITSQLSFSVSRLKVVDSSPPVFN